MKWLKNIIPDTIFTRLLSAFCKMGIVILTARYFGVEGRGLIGILAYSMTLLMLISEFVGGSSLITLVPDHKLKNLLFPSYLWAFIVCSIGYLVLPYWPEVPSAVHVHIFFLSLILAFITINYSLLIGKQKIRWQNWSSLSIVLVTLLFLILVLLILDKHDVIYYIYALYLGEGVGFIISIYLLISHFKNEFSGGFKIEPDLFKQGFLSQSGHLIQFFNYRLSYFFILAYLSQSALGLYATVFVLPDTIWIFGNSIGTVLHMKVVNKTEKDLTGLTLKYLKMSTMITGVLILIVLIIPAEFWAWLLGNDFIGIKEIFYWLVPGTLALGISTCISHYYHAIKKFIVLIWANAIGLIVKVSILIYFGQSLSLNNVAMASSIGLCAITLVLILKFYFDSKDIKKAISLTDGFNKL